jgi:hypothetical protein
MRHGLKAAFAVAMSGPWLSLAAAAPQDDAKQAKVKEAYDKVAQAYLNSDWAELANAQKETARHATSMTREQRAELLYIRKTAAEFRPPWWKSCKSTVKTDIRARIWGRNVAVHYVPSDKAGVSAQIDGQRITLWVSWNPSLVDSPTPEKGELAEQHALTTGDLGEVGVWQQLGASYITAVLPANTLVALYRQNQHLYRHLEGFFAITTSMYHCSPKARRAAMLVHASTVQSTTAPEAYVRACRVVSSLFIATVLAEPKKWPSVNLPYTTPEDQIEKNVGIYLYTKVQPTWTIAEDRAFREVLREFFRTNADRAVRGRGRIALPNKLAFVLMEPDDRDCQKKRDAWVKEQLEKASK